MTKRKILKTTKKEIATYWQDRIETGAISVSFAQATTHCWRCGVKKRLDRCHIVPQSKGGLDEPNNYVLLCKHCHIDNPNVDDVAIVWDWLGAYALQGDNPFWYEQGAREYAFMYGEPLEVSLATYGIAPATFTSAFTEGMKEAGFHFGQPRHNAATVAGVMKRVIDALKTVD